MRHLNYSHLKYFWAVAREGSIAKASAALNVTPQTISGQIKLLEQSVGEPLFNRSGRRLVLSETGRVVFGYADEIFTIGSELANVVRGNQAVGPAVLTVGTVSSMPKLIAERIIAPALSSDSSIRIRCHEASLEQLLGELAVHHLDLVISDQPMPRGLSLRAYNHRLGESGLSFFAAPKKAGHLSAGFPKSLNGAAMLLPTTHSALRRRMDDWFDAEGIAPNVVGEFDDSALLKAFGEAGAGLFAAPTAIEKEICRMYRMKVVGRTTAVKERFYAISPERRLRNEAVLLITETARADLFDNPKTRTS